MTAARPLEASDLSVLERLVQPSGKDVLDIGCGGGALARELVRLGARVVGIEISEQQLTAALGRGGGPRYLVGRAEALPLADASVDLAVFMRSLHHVPPAALEQALREARRALRPGGIVYVAEPLAEGEYYALTSMVEPEHAVRAAAQRAIAQAPRLGLEREATVEYDIRICLADLAALRARYVAVDPARAERFDAREAALAEVFASLGEAGESPGERCFRQPMRADALRAAP